MHQRKRSVFSVQNALFIVAAMLVLSAARPAQAEKLNLTVVDKATGQVIPCRLHLKTQRGMVRRVLRQPFWHDHFVFDGNIVLDLPVGTYLFELERGPEYRIVTGHFIIQRNSQDAKTVALERVVDMQKEGWWSGDLHVERPLDEMELLMLADDLHLAAVTTWTTEKDGWTKKVPPQDAVVSFGDNRAYSLFAGRDDRAGGALQFFNLPEPWKPAPVGKEYPSSMKFIRAAREGENVWIDAQKPFAFDLPLWLASGQLDSIGLCNSNMHRGGFDKSEHGGRLRDRVRFPDPWGNGQWSEHIYYQVLNVGLRIPPSAGSGTGDVPNPLGYDRMYVYLDDEFSYQRWWEGFRSGAVVVTNGPLLRPKVRKQPPGYIFTGPAGEAMELEIGLNLATRDPIPYLEIVKDGKVFKTVRLDEWAKKAGRLPPVEFTESGWFLVRAVTDVATTYRYASSAPWYVQIGEEPRISRSACKFFLDWTEFRIAGLKIADPAQKQEVLEEWERARVFWQSRMASANAE